MLNNCSVWAELKISLRRQCWHHAGEVEPLERGSVMASLSPPHRTSVNVVTSAECRQAVCLPLITVWEPNSITVPCCQSVPFHPAVFMTELIYHVYVIPLEQRWRAALSFVSGAMFVSNSVTSWLISSLQMCDFCSTMTIFSGKVQQSKSFLDFEENILNFLFFFKPH